MTNLFAEASSQPIDWNHWTPGAVFEIFKWMLASAGTAIGFYSLYQTAKTRAKGQQDHAESQAGIAKNTQDVKVLAQASPVSVVPVTTEIENKVNAIATSTGTGPGTLPPDPYKKIGSALDDGNRP